MPAEVRSPADAAFPLLQQLIARAVLLGADDPDQSEADTRAKLIDPLFRDVLGWRETDITREEPAADGFADYSFGTDFKWFHVEAKRTLPRFLLHAPSRSRQLKLSGSHLLGNKALKPLLEQAAKYAPDLGTQFAILTNGTQFILFEATPRGKSWRDGYAQVWHDHKDIEDNFAEFYSILARQYVEAGVLSEEFAKSTSVTAPAYTPLDYIHNPDGELVRNPFWNKISRAFSPILIDQPENSALQEEIIRHCYVSTPLAGESSTNLGQLLRDIMPKYVEDAGARHLGPDDRSARSFQVRFVDDLKLAKPGTYILTGGVGSGKTSFLRRFATVNEHAFIRGFCVWLHVDFLPVGVAPDDVISGQIEEYTYKQILEILRVKYPIYVPQSGEDIRKIFAPEIDEAKLTLLYGVNTESPEYHAKVNQLVDDLARNKERYLHAILRHIRKSGKCLVFVLDNTDQLGEKFQQAVFLFSQKLSETYSTLSVVSLREEKFFAAYRQGVFDAYGTRKFHIGSPELIDVIKKRLRYGVRRYKQLAQDEGLGERERARNEDVVWSLVESSTVKNGNIIRFLACVSAGDMRLALSMYNDFMSSGNTNVDNIMRIVSRQRDPYMMPFHEFAKSAILGARRYFKGSVSRVINVFSPSTVRGASHWTCSRVMARLLSGQHTQSAYGEGYILTRDLLLEYRESFGTADDFTEVCERLLLGGLLESEPPRVAKLAETEALRITATGAYYWSFLVRSFAYLDLVLVDTPCGDEALARDLAALSEKRKEDFTLPVFIRIRIARVLKFLEYMASLDQQEIDASSRRGGPYRECLSNVIKEQLDRELWVIRGRTGAGGTV